MRSEDPQISAARLAFKQKDFARAIALAREVLARFPQSPDAMNVLANSFLQLGCKDDALPLLERVIELRPHFKQSRLNLAMLLLELGRLDEARTHLQTVGSDAIAALHELARAFDAAQRHEDAEETLQHIVKLAPDDLAAHWGIAAIELHEGQIDNFLATSRTLVTLAPQDPHLHSQLVFAQLYHPDVTPQKLADTCRGWANAHEAPLQATKPVFEMRDRNHARRLRIGYVSPYFREHSVAFFIEPLLAHHARDRFEVFCYSDVKQPDEYTGRMQSLVHTWRDSRALHDAALADLVRSDQIDILVDLSQHLSGNRLPTFAHKPAPVQVSYLGYPGTTGLESIDYRFGDKHLDNDAALDQFNSERVVRLPQTYFCYHPPDAAPDVVEPPYLRRGYATFVSHHGLLKLNARCLHVWSRVLHAVPGSRLVIKARGLSSRRAVRRLLDAFNASGIDPQRIDFVAYSSLYRAMEELNDADIALDAIPFSGGTTTCHTLWMGVPVVTLAGQMSIHRMAHTVLAQLQLQELSAGDEDQYVLIAAKLADDGNRLSELRRTMRERMRSSPLMDGPRFAMNVEAVYRRMWQDWCSR